MLNEQLKLKCIHGKYPQIITTNALFNVNYNSRNKYTSEDLQDPDVQKNCF